MQYLNETALKNQILDFLTYTNIIAWLTNTTGNYNKKTDTYYKNPRLRSGVADILGVMPVYGTLLAIECKHGKNEQTEKQKDFEKDIIKNAGIYILAYSVDDVIKALGPYHGVTMPKNYA